ncbi:MAG TPA: hypothetical protein VF198_17715 [Vicinamibacterales bacterium]
MRRWTPAVLTMLLALAGPGMTSTSADSGWYSIQDLGFPGEPSTATAVNAGGDAVGYSGAATAVPFLQSAGLGPQALPLSGTGTWATAINASRQVALHGQNPNHAYRHDPGSAGLVDLTPGAMAAQAYDIDNAGRVVGFEINGAQVAVRWTDTGTETIGMGLASAALGTSRNGQFVVGFAVDSTGANAFRWSASGGLQTLAVPGTSAVAEGVNDAGDVVGYAISPAVGILWPANSTTPVPLDGFTQALAINLHGDIVGYGPGASGTRALLYRGGEVIDLNTRIDPASGWVLRKATGINDAGQIVGEGVRDGVVRGFLLTPAVASDTTPPVIAEVRTAPDSIWPPNHQMVPVSVQVFASDDSGETPVCAVTSVTSSDPDNASGSGNTEVDAVIDGPLSVRVRAERSGPVGARVYTIAVTCSDAAGNSSTANGYVQVGDLSSSQQRNRKR